jgi:4-hydroxyproline epimerase
MPASPKKIRIVDSHTGGEPTRLAIDGGPDLGNGSMVERLSVFRNKFDRFRSAIVNEPRGSEAMVGALLCKPADPSSAAGVIFFNNVGYLGMCGHGAMGVIVSLAYLNQITPGCHKIETPAGLVTAELFEDGQVAITNVPSYRLHKEVVVAVEGFGSVTGDIAWGGNWFFLGQGSHVPVDLANIDALIDYGWRIREALKCGQVRGAAGEEIDHIELFSENGPNFVLCPGKVYDRSPCGTGTSAKVACLYSDGKLKAGEIRRQESIVGSVFEASVSVENGVIHPTIKGSAFVNAESVLILDERDPFCWGIPR